MRWICDRIESAIATGAGRCAIRSLTAAVTVSVPVRSPIIHAVAITATPAAPTRSVRATDGLRVARSGARCCPDESAMSSSAVTTSAATDGRSSGSLASR